MDEDEDEFLDFARSKADVVILPQITDRDGGEEFSSLRESLLSEFGGDCHLWNRSISPKPDYNFVSQQECYCMDFLQSEVVNVIPSQRVGNKITEGRLHIETTILLPDNTIAEKSTEFLKWFDSLRRWIKRNFKATHKGARVSPRVQAFVDKGGEFGY